jgi:hypothetical protein
MPYNVTLDCAFAAGARQIRTSAAGMRMFMAGDVN